MEAQVGFSDRLFRCHDAAVGGGESRKAHRIRSLRRGLASTAVALVLASCGGDGSPVEPDGPDVHPPGTGTVGAAGGVVSLLDGTSVYFPPGAVSGDVRVTVVRGSAGAYLDGPSTAERVAVTTTATVSQFGKPVEVRVPLPPSMTPADTTALLVGLVAADGRIDALRSLIRVIEGRPFAVIETTHFSTWHVEAYAGRTLPPRAGPLDVPFYHQGATTFCWAASIQMVTQAVRRDAGATVPGLIGRIGVDPGGLTEDAWLTDTIIRNVIKERTGQMPTRLLWRSSESGTLLSYLRHEIAFEGRPVALHMSTITHAVVVVGYDGDDFLIHDPRTGEGNPGYERWSSEKLITGFNVLWRIASLSVPAPLAAGATLTTLNFETKAFDFVRRRQTPEAPAGQYTFVWDHTVPRGYTYRALDINGTPDAVPLPGDVVRLSFAEEGIHLVNASLTQGPDVRVTLAIDAVDAPTGTVGWTHDYAVTVPPNGSHMVKPVKLPGEFRPGVDVDRFRHNRLSPTDYDFTVSAEVGGVVVARQTVRFSIAPAAPPALTAIAPAVAGTGQEVTLTGSDFGAYAINNRVVFNGAEVPAGEIVSWTEGEIKVRVPAGAISGPVRVHRGEVPSNAVAFTLSATAIIGGSLQGNDGGSTFWGPSAITTNAVWTFEAEQARIRASDDETRYRSLRFKNGTPAELHVTGTAAVDPATYVQSLPDGSRIEYTYRVRIEASTSSSGGVPIVRTGPDGDVTLSFTMNSLSQSLTLDVWAGGYYDAVHYRPDGTVESTTTNEYAGGTMIASFYIQSEP